MPQLFFTDPDGRRRSVLLEGGCLSLGRSNVNDLSFPRDDGLSRQHLVFERDGDRWTVRNLESKNGTFVNGMRISHKHTLQPGDEVRASSVVMTFGDRGASESRVTFEPFSGAETQDFTSCVSLQDVVSTEDSGTLVGVNRGRVSAVWAFVRAGRELALNRPLPELFRVVLDLSLEAVGAERGVLLTLDEGDRLAVQASKGGEFRISTTVRDRVLKEGSSLLIRNVLEDKSLQSSKTILGQGVHSLMAVPLQTDRRIIGLIYVDSSNTRDTFTPDDLDLLTAMANVASIRIERERWEFQRRLLISDNVASLGRLAAALSHEFNSPLGTLKSTVDTLLRTASKRETASAKEQPRLAALEADLRHAIDASLERMQEVISRIQRFTNLDRAEAQWVHVNELLRDVITLAETAPKPGKVEVTLDSEPLPELLCQPQQLNAAFSGLLSFLMHGCWQDSQAPSEIRLSTRVRGERVEIEMKGEGQRLAAKDLAHVFDPGFEIVRGRVSTGNWSLFSARQIIRDQGGEISISSRGDTQISILVALPLS